MFARRHRASEASSKYSGDAASLAQADEVIE
jgi:hypothetical protein